MPLDYNQFAEKIKQKYPEYKDIDNYTLATKMVEKYPEYQTQVSLKKKRNHNQLWFKTILHRID